MSNLTCKSCGTMWDGASQAQCPMCLTRTWTQAPDFVRSKHDPRSLGSISSQFRSVMSGEFMQGSVDQLLYAANNGTVFQSLYHGGKYCYLAPAPVGTPAGSAVPAGGTVTSTALDNFVIADLTGSPHIYAESQTRIRQGINAGSYIPLSHCIEHNCDNLALPGDHKCARHVQPALAD
jgi:hypothetical protein